MKAYGCSCTTRGQSRASNRIRTVSDRDCDEEVRVRVRGGQDALTILTRTRLQRSMCGPERHSESKAQSVDVSGVLHNMCCYLQVLKRLREPLNLRLAAIQDSQGSHEQFFFVCEGPRVRIFFSIPLVSTLPVSVSTARNFDFPPRANPSE